MQTREESTTNMVKKELRDKLKDKMQVVACTSMPMIYSNSSSVVALEVTQVAGVVISSTSNSILAVAEGSVINNNNKSSNSKLKTFSKTLMSLSST